MRDALKTALDALEEVASEMTVGDRFTDAGQGVLDAINICRDATKQEPVAWLIPGTITKDADLARANGNSVVPLYKGTP